LRGLLLEAHGSWEPGQMACSAVLASLALAAVMLVLLVLGHLHLVGSHPPRSFDPPAGRRPGAPGHAAGRLRDRAGPFRGHPGLGWRSHHPEG
jgi:hypothetical protein